MRYYFKKGRFGCVSTIGNEYDAQLLVDLMLIPEASYDERNAISLMNMFSELNPTIFRNGPCPPFQYGLRFNGNVLRKVIDILFHDDQINASDRSEIEEHIKTFEKAIERRPLVSAELNTSQEEIMEMILSPYIDGIVAEVSNLSLAIKLCGIGFCDIPLGNKGTQETKNLIINNYMRTAGIKDEFETLVTDKEKRQEIYDCIWQIWRIYSQAEKIEDTFLKLGQHLPSMKSQRESIARALFKSVNNKLSSDEHRFDEVIETASALLKKNNLNKDIISKIQNPKVIQESSYTVQNALLHGLFLDRQSRHDSETTSSQSPSKPS